METVEDIKIVSALEKRKEYILANLENVTMKALRKELEQDLGLQKDELKPHKNVIVAYVDKLLVATRAGQATQEDGKTGDEEAGANKSAGVNELCEGDTSFEKKQPVKGEGVEESAPKSKQPVTQFSAKVMKLKNLCKEATIPVPPNLYVKYKKDNNMDDLERGILDILKKHGLDGRSGKLDVAKVRDKLQLARDLDGIDTSNIIEGGGRGRRQRAAATKYTEDTEEEEEVEEEEEGMDVGDESASDDDYDHESEEELEVASPGSSKARRADDDGGEVSPATNSSKERPNDGLADEEKAAEKKQRVGDWSDDD